MPQAPAATAASASAPLAAPHEVSPGLEEPLELEKKSTPVREAPPLPICANPRPTLEGAPPPKTPPPQVHDDQSLVPFPFSSTSPAPKPWRHQPRLAPARALPTGGDDYGDRRALAVPYECGHSH